MGRALGAFFHRVTFVVALTCLLLTAAAGPVDRVQAADNYQISMTVVVKPEHLCVGQKARVVFMVDVVIAEASLTPLSPLEIRAIPTAGTITPDRWSFPPTEGTNIAYMDYDAKKEGHDDITFVANWGSDRTLLPDVPIEVFQCQYHVTINGTRTAVAKGYMTSVNFYEGEGDFDLLLDRFSKSKGDISIAGAGSVKVDLALGMNVGGGTCATSPNQMGTYTFRIRGKANKDQDLQMDFLFDPGTVSGGVSNCNLFGHNVSKPLEPAPLLMQTKNLIGMSFSPLGDQKEFSGAVFDSPPPDTTITENVSVSVKERSK